MRRFTLALLLALITPMLAAGEVAAQDHSASDEYTEHVPGVGGDSPSSDHTGGGGGASGGSSGDGGGGAPGSSAVPQAAVDDFNASGADGQGAAALAEQTAPTGHPADDRSAASGAGDDGTASERAPSDSGGGIGGVVDEVVGTSDSGGMGIALPIILGATLLAALLFLLARHRGSGEPGSV